MTNERHGRTLGTRHVVVAGVGLVVAASTLVSDMTGFVTLGAGYVIALLLGLGVNALLGMSASELAVAHPHGGGLYDYARSALGGAAGRFLGVAAGVAFWGTVGLAISGEVTAGAYALRSLLGDVLPVEVAIALLSVAAIIPNVLGIRTAAAVSAGLLVLMLAARWGFGIAGFAGLAHTGAWSAANLTGPGGLPSFTGDGGILGVGLALAFWTYVGIEFAAGISGEVRDPGRSVPRGILIGLGVIFATSVVMGLGVFGTMPLAAWQTATASSLGAAGNAPQLAVGELVLGRPGYVLMAIGSVASTLSSLTVAYTVLPLILNRMGRDGSLGSAVGRGLARLHPRFGTPVVAILVTAAAFTPPALASAEVVDWVYSAAYAWAGMYVGFHVLVLLRRWREPAAPTVFGRATPVVAGLGVVATVGTIAVAFAGAHGAFGLRALIVLGGGLAVAGLNEWVRARDRSRVELAMGEDPLTTAS